MSYSTKELATHSGVTSRALRYWDRIDLLKPAYYGLNGMRYYGEEQLLKLQQILFYKELGFELKRIKALINSSSFNRIDALRSHQRALEHEQERVKRLIQTIERTIKSLKGEEAVSDLEIYYDGFKDDDRERFEQLFIEYGGEEARLAIAQNRRSARALTKADWIKKREETDRLYEALAEELKKGAKPSSKEVQRLLSVQLEQLKDYFTPTKRVYEALIRLYIEHPDFQKFWQSYHPKMASFLRESMEHFAPSLA